MLEAYAALLPIAVPTIEEVEGGSIFGEEVMPFGLCLPAYILTRNYL